MRLTLARKMLLGNLTLVLMIVVVGLSALANLKALHRLGANLVQVNLPNLELIAELTELLSNQGEYEQRYLDLHDAAVRDLADDAREKFHASLTRFVGLPDRAAQALGRIQMLSAEYDRVSAQARTAWEAGDEATAKALAKGLVVDRRQRVAAALQSLGQALKDSQLDALQHSQELTQQALILTLATCGVGLVFGVGFALVFSRSLARSLQQFKTATLMIGKGRYDGLPALRGDDEVGDLAESFRWMSRRLQELEEMNLDANPLTRLPGNLAIEKALLTRMQRKHRFAFCHIDLDNFKAFGDHYGYARGSEVLKMVGQLLVRLIAGNLHGDFIGHIGGDDFVLICDPERVSSLCQRIIKEFDTAIPEFYDAADREQGFIVSRDRNDSVQQFGIMTISIAVVTNERRDIASPVQVAEIAAQLKKYAKSFPKSIFVVDQRREV